MKKLRYFPIGAVVVAFSTVLSLLVGAAQASVERGIEIAQAVEEGDRGYGDESVTGEMTIRSPDGTVGHRVFTMFTLEVREEGDKRAVVFDEPRDLAGFVSLNHTEVLEPDKQWIYVPAINRTRRLSARDKTGAFAGSEFTYEDITRWEYEKYEYEFVREEDCASKAPCAVIANVPRYGHSGYSKLLESVDMQILQPRRIIYHDRQGRPYKTLELSEYRQFDRFWRPMKMVMTNNLTGAVSEVRWGEYRFGSGLGSSDFKAARIKRWARVK